jgi:hypothetical protein
VLLVSGAGASPVVWLMPRTAAVPATISWLPGNIQNSIEHRQPIKFHRVTGFIEVGDRRLREYGSISYS